MRTILISMWDQTTEDAALLGNSRNLNRDGDQEGAYQFIGADSDRRVPMVNFRFVGTRFSFNYFRTGEMGNSVNPSANIQRRIVIANGSTSELLFSLTPEGTSDVVRPQVTGERDNILAAINSVNFTAEEPVAPIAPIEITTSQVLAGSLTIEFTNNPGATDFTILGSPDLADTDPLDLTESAVVSEISEGVFRAVVDISAMEPRMFFWISR